MNKSILKNFCIGLDLVMNMKKILLAICICVLSIPLSSYTYYAKTNDNLIIVAHPDDETIWAGEHLIRGSYTVLCITNGNNKTRKAEFEKVLKQTNSEGRILPFPDKTNGQRDNWKSCKNEITEEIKKIIDSKDWSTIVCHNPDGEYGHIHHKMVSQIVTNILKSEKNTDKLIYFGKYTCRKNKDQLKNEKSLSSKYYKQKLKLCDIYSSQSKVMNHLHHMLKYENWIPYKNWDKMK